MFLNVCKNFSHISRVRISKSFNVKCEIFKTHYFYMKTKILADFEGCINVPLTCQNLTVKSTRNLKWQKFLGSLKKAAPYSSVSWMHFTELKKSGAKTNHIELATVLPNVKKVTLNENVRFTNYTSEIQPPDSIEFATNRKNDNSHNFPTWRHRPIFLTLICFSCQVYLLVQVSCQYHRWFWSYYNFLLCGIDQKSGSRNHPSLSFAQYLTS